MSVLQKVKIHDNERLDLTDFENIEHFVCADFGQLSKRVLNVSSLIVKGFTVYQDEALTDAFPTASPVYIKLEDSTLLHTSSDEGYSLYVGPSGTDPEEVSLTSNATNYIEVDLVEVTAATDNRAFWDPTANDGEGGEFVQAVDTVTNLEASITVNTSGFSGGNKIPIAQIEVDNAGAIVAVYDRRNMFFRLATGQPYDGDNQSSYTGGRYEAIHTITLGDNEGSYLHVQSSADTTWTINHNLGQQYCHFTFYDSSNNEIFANTVTAVSSTQATAVFSSAQDGYCLVTIGDVGDYYIYTNGAAATNWAINHALAQQYCNITVFDTSNVLIEPQLITATNANNMSVDFAVAQDGFAIVSKAGGAGSGYLHTEAVASVSWTINHNLGTLFVCPTFYNGSDEVIIPDSVTVVTPNQLIATFTSSQAGFCWVSEGSGGTYVAGETVTGLTSGTTAVVVTGGFTSITVHGKSAPTFTIGEVLTGSTSLASHSIETIVEHFDTSDKSFNTLKESLDAIMTEFIQIKWGSTANKYWFQDVGTNMNELDSRALRAFASITDDGVTASLNDSYNVSSVTLNSAGNITVNWDTDFSNDDYAVTVTPEGSALIVPRVVSKAVGSAVIQLVNASNVATDSNFSIMAVGDQA